MYTDAVPAKVGQGTIVKDIYFYAIDEARSAISLTPICDLEQSKAEMLQLSALFDAWEIAARLFQGDWGGAGLIDREGKLIPGPLSGTKTKEFNDKVRQLIGQRFPRYHWLAPLPATDRPLLADFQVLTALPIEEVMAQNILTELKSPFREQIAARYASYMGRVGTPDFSKEQIDGWLAQGLRHLFPTPKS